MDWDDLHVLKVLGEAGTVRGAAGLLGVNASTVTRKLEQVEADLGVVLFTRSAQGLHATQEMLSIRRDIEAVGDQIAQIHHHLQGFNQRLEGRIRCAVPDAVALEFLLTELAGFVASYPDIELEIIPGYQQLDLAGGEVDVAIRATDKPPENMVGRPLERVGLAAYASRDFIHQQGLDTGADERPATIDWVDWADEGEVMDQYRRLQAEFFPSVHVRMRCDHVHMHSRLLQAGVGAGILPCFVGDSDPVLQRLPTMPVQDGPMLWLLSHPDLRAARRVHVFLEFVTDVFRRHAGQITGIPVE